MLLYETMTTVKWVNKKFRNILKLLFIKTLEKKPNSCNMYVVRPPSALILAGLHNFVLAESFLFYRFQNLTLIKLIKKNLPLFPCEIANISSLFKRQPSKRGVSYFLSFLFQKS